MELLLFKIMALSLSLISPYIIIGYPNETTHVINHPIFIAFMCLILSLAVLHPDYVLSISIITAWISLILCSQHVQLGRKKNFHQSLSSKKEEFTPIYDDIPIPEPSHKDKDKDNKIRCGSDYSHELVNRTLQLERDVWFRDMLVKDAKEYIDDFCTNDLGLTEVSERYDKILKKL
jgi:hypothetical protein